MPKYIPISTTSSALGSPYSNYGTYSNYSATSSSCYSSDTTRETLPVKKEQPMDQYILSPKKLKKMLEDAFIAGYESPVEMMNQEIARIYKEALSELKTVNTKRPEPPEKSPEDSPEESTDVSDLPIYDASLFEYWSP